MNLITFDEIIRLLRAMDLGLMTEDAVANQIMKYKEMENLNNIRVVSSEPSIQATDINKALHNLAKRKDSRRLVVQRDSKGKRIRDGLLSERGSDEFNDDMTVEWIREYH